MEFGKEKVSFNIIEQKNMTVNINASEPIEDNAKLLSVNGICCVGRSEIIGGELIIEGTVQFCTVYKNGEGEIKKLTKSEHFSKNETFNGIKGNSVALTSGKACKVRGYTEAGNILFNCTVELCTKIFIPSERDIPIIDENDFLRKKETELTVIDDVMTVPLRFSVQEKTELSPRLPDVKEILFINAVPNVTEANIIANQLVFGGEFFVQTTYATNDEYEPIVQINDKFDFSQITDVSGISDNENVSVYLAAENAFGNVSQNAEGENRLIDYTFDFCGYSYSCTEKNIKVIDDIYSVKEKLTVENESFTAKTEKLSYKNQGNRSITVSLVDGKLPMSRINSVNLYAGNTELAGNTLKIQADVNVNYQSSAGENEGFNTCTDFEIPTEVNNASSAQIVITDVQGILISGNEMEVRISYSLRLYSNTENTVNYVNKIESTAESQMPEYGIIIYTVQKNDSLWDICKHFCVDEDEVMSMNPELNNGIYYGQKIYIFRKLAV